MTHTHRCIVIGGWFKGVDEEGEFFHASQLRQDYPDVPLRIRAISPPGEVQPVDNITPDPNLSTWYVEGSLEALEAIAINNNYEILPPYIEEIPTDVIL